MLRTTSTFNTIMKHQLLHSIATLLLMTLLFAFAACAKNNGYTADDFRANYKHSDFATVNSNSGIWQDAQAGIQRHHICVFRTSDVPDDSYDLAVQGLERIIDETGRNISVMQEESRIAPEYMPPDWYQEETMMDKQYLHGLQANAGDIIDLLRSHNTTNDHFVVLITSADLTSGEEGNNFVFGLSSYPFVVISARRFLDWKAVGKDNYPVEIYDRALSLMAAHEFGHYLDLVQRNFNSWRNTGTLVDRHCKGENGPCLMQQSNVDIEGCNTILEQAELIFSRDRWLCPDCAAEVYYRREALVEAGIAW